MRFSFSFSLPALRGKSGGTFIPPSAPSNALEYWGTRLNEDIPLWGTYAENYLQGWGTLS